MEEVSRRISRIAIQADARCIGCGDCTRACQMGIDVQRFAQNQHLLNNSNSACIQCGICIAVCPMDVLSIAPNQPVSMAGQLWWKPPSPPWEQAQ
jgi:ferredoxin